jgi:hypothetical protein
MFAQCRDAAQSIHEFAQSLDEENRGASGGSEVFEIAV